MMCGIKVKGHEPFATIIEQKRNEYKSEIELLKAENQILDDELSHTRSYKEDLGLWVDAYKEYLIDWTSDQGQTNILIDKYFQKKSGCAWKFMNVYWFCQDKGLFANTW